MINHKTNIMMICETYFTKKHFLRIHNNAVYSIEHGGSALIRKSIKHYKQLAFEKKRRDRGLVKTVYFLCQLQPITLEVRFLCKGDFIAKY